MVHYTEVVRYSSNKELLFHHTSPILSWTFLGPPNIKSGTYFLKLIINFKQKVRPHCEILNNKSLVLSFNLLL